jgi:hypothetical protein
MAAAKNSQTSDSALAEWLAAQGRTQVWLALKLGISVASASRIVRGATMPRPRLAKRIVALTNGRVTEIDLSNAKMSITPANRAARIRYAKDLISRGSSLLEAATTEGHRD